MDSDLFLEGTSGLQARQEGAISAEMVYSPSLPSLITRLGSIEEIFNEEKIASLNADRRLKVFIVGYPCEVGARNMDARAGGERAPDTFRELLQFTSYPSEPATSQATTQAFMDTITLIDCGNIQIDQGKASEKRDEIMTEAGLQLKNTVKNILSKVGNSSVFVVGGTDDLTVSLMEACNEVDHGAGFDSVILDPSLDVKPKHRRQIDEFEPTYHETFCSHLRKVFSLTDDDQIPLDNLRKVTFVGLQGHRVSQREVDFVRAKETIETELLYIGKDIRAAGKTCSDVFRQLMEDSSSDRSTLVSLDLSVIQSHFAPGVGLPCPAMGLTDLEAVEIGSLTGRNPRARLFSLTEYNPAIEKFKTSALINAIFNSWLQGMRQRPSK